MRRGTRGASVRQRDAIKGASKGRSSQTHAERERASTRRSKGASAGRSSHTHAEPEVRVAVDGLAAAVDVVRVGLVEAVGQREQVVGDLLVVEAGLAIVVAWERREKEGERRERGERKESEKEAQGR